MWLDRCAGKCSIKVAFDAAFGLRWFDRAVRGAVGRVAATTGELRAEVGGPIFISHASVDSAFVRQLREVLEARHLSVWVDLRELRGGNKLG